MSRIPDDMYEVSERLSEVMDDIGVNERHVMKRRRRWMLKENLETICEPDNEPTTYHFGSQTEGSTTLGLKSDRDTLLHYWESFNIIQNENEWKPGVGNLMMIQNENISPGYCYLQSPSADIGTKTMEHFATDSDGRLLVKNTALISIAFLSKLQIYAALNKQGEYLQIHGPAITDQRYGEDTVIGHYCESSPHQVTPWLQKQRGCKWPTEDVLEKCRNVGCFVVPVGGKVSYEPELEWRISTSLQERYLMFSLNIYQLRCYILMKMILKTYINPQVEDVLSSYMCKNVLWYCIANSSHDWHTGNLLSYLHLCLFMLKECVEQRNCPHLMIPENNLLAGRMTDTQRGNLLDIINNLMENDVQSLYEIQIDDLGRRLRMIPYCPDILHRKRPHQFFSSDLVIRIAKFLSGALYVVLRDIKHESLERALPYLQLHEIHKREGDFYQRTASELLIPLVSSTLGSVIASSNIASHTAISDQAFSYLEAGKESDVLSGRLKLISVLYCTGDMERAESEIRIIETQYDISKLQTLCPCSTDVGITTELKLGFVNACEDYDESAIKSHAAVCTSFTQCETNCVPHELRYEMLRSYIKEDKQMRTVKDSLWMDYIVVDSIPYLYFLKYKICGHLQNRIVQQKTLYSLASFINLEPNLGHKEVALNLLGQCMEQENRQAVALYCYIRSLKHLRRNNVASFLLCIQLFKLLKQDNAQ